MVVLAIETSCDDTCVAIIEADRPRRRTPGSLRGRRRYQRGFGRIKILSNIISSQVKLHAKYGGVYPFLAKREHQKNLPIVLKKALKKAKSASRRAKIDLIAVTVGPGLEPCLWVGVNFAKDLAKKLNLPIIPVNHIEAHILANWLTLDIARPTANKIFPAICLIVSGGHTQLILAKDFGKYKILGETRDDAAGECFDKVARILGLSYPGGPAIEKEASKLPATSYQLQIKLPRPMIYQKNYDFSFSGLKTAVLYNYRSQKPRVRKSKKYIQAMSAETQQAIIDVLIHKTIKAAKEYKAKAIILGGGVTANKELRRQFKVKIRKELPDINYLLPDTKLCTDNALMIAVAAYYHWLKEKGKGWKKIKADANLRIG